ncbi:MAG: aminomethyl-transferring glycine dehydrogenase subunit GcvPB [Candidatus Hydrogenedens sp.]|jgi:glycine dehydrogenase subunit 2|nr:aminomethyl-transferring glycine dehydrogenase subunit GcvPB [Candidatus Hydrogenedens sp.]
MDKRTVFEASVAGRQAIMPPPLDVPLAEMPEELKRSTPLALPELSELDVVRHFTRLSRKNFGVDSHFYPLGSCTMKYNPKIAEVAASHPGFTDLHPQLISCESYLKSCQGALRLIYEMEELLAEIGGLDAGCTQPMAGAHGELTGVLLIAAYHRDHGNKGRDTILVPDSAHGTNPASAAIAGFKVREVASTSCGIVDFEDFKKCLADDVAGVMLTCPNTHGLFEPHVAEMSALAHEAGALMYYDGANLNAIVGRARPGELGFDVMHYNLHKSFGTPHGMGGPGSGAIAVNALLAPYLPGPRVVKSGNNFVLEEPEKTIGPMTPFFGNFLVVVRAFAYLRALGGEGLKEVSKLAALNANYLLHRLKEEFPAAYEGLCMHECLLTAEKMEKESGISALDIAKALLDRGFHAPTVYFPLTVKEGLMIEPTETESRETLDAFCDAMMDIARLAKEDPDALHRAPETLPVGRLDEVKAARMLDCADLPESD